METLAPTKSERGAEMARDCIGPRVVQIERAVAQEIARNLGNAEAIEQALDDISDLRRWPQFCIYLAMVIMPDPSPTIRDAAIVAIRKMLSGAMEDRAMAAVMADLGLR